MGAIRGHASRSRELRRARPESSIAHLVDGGGVVVAPLLVKKSHWVLLVITGKTITIYDSLPSYTKDEAKDFATKLLEHRKSAGKSAPAVHVAATPIQAAGSNDCGLWVMRSLVAYINNKSIMNQGLSQRSDSLFPRTWLKEHLGSDSTDSARPTSRRKLEAAVLAALGVRKCAAGIADNTAKQAFVGTVTCYSCKQPCLSGRRYICKTCNVSWHNGCLSGSSRLHNLPKDCVLVTEWECTACARCARREDLPRCPYVPTNINKVCDRPIEPSNGISCVSCKKRDCLHDLPRHSPWPRLRPHLRGRGSAIINHGQSH
eukprot:PhM_4_TR17416/c2_g1_i1/m.82267